MTAAGHGADERRDATTIFDGEARIPVDTSPDGPYMKRRGFGAIPTTSIASKEIS